MLTDSGGRLSTREVEGEDEEDNVNESWKEFGECGGDGGGVRWGRDVGRIGREIVSRGGEKRLPKVSEGCAEYTTDEEREEQIIDFGFDLNEKTREGSKWQGTNGEDATR